MIQKAFNQLLGMSSVGALAVSKAKAPQQGLKPTFKERLERTEGQVKELGKFDVESGKFKGTRKDFENIKRLGLDKTYSDLIKEGVNIGELEAGASADILGQIEKKLTPTKASQVKQKAKQFEIERLAKEKAISRMQSKGISKIQQKQELDSLLQSLEKDDTFQKLSPAAKKIALEKLGG